MGVVEQAIKASVDRGDLSVGVFLILGYPSIQESLRALEVLERLGITVFETAVPVTRDWSSHANAVIKEAHLCADSNSVTRTDVLQTFSALRPNLYILYRDTYVSLGSELFEEMSEKADTVLLEWDQLDTQKVRRSAHKWGISVAQSVSPFMREADFAFAVRTAEDLVYLTASDRTGGKILPMYELERAIDCIKGIRDIPVWCGFGIKDPEDVRRIGAIPGCDGVVVGTAALRAQAFGVQAFEGFIASLVQAATGLKHAGRGRQVGSRIG